MSGTLALAAGLVLALHLAAEPLMRRGEARSVATSAFEHHSTALVSIVGITPVALALGVRWLWPDAPWPVPSAVGWTLVGAIAAGAVLRFWSMATLGAFFSRTLRVTPAQRLVRSGPYRLLRHPGYLANLLAYPSAAVVLADSLLLGALALPALALAYAQRIRHEEEMLVAAFGAEYERYRQRTWRLLPWLY